MLHLYILDSKWNDIQTYVDLEPLKFKYGLINRSIFKVFEFNSAVPDNLLDRNGSNQGSPDIIFGISGSNVKIERQTCLRNRDLSLKFWARN